MTFQNILKHKRIYLFMALWMFMLSVAPSNSSSMVISSYSYLKDNSRQQDVDRIKQFLTQPVAKKQLTRLGLSQEQIIARLDRLSDEQVHSLAARTDTIKSGGDATGMVLLVVFVVLIIVAILYLTDYQVKIEKKRK